MSPDVLVIGGGVSGLCAAVDIASRGHSVLLAEQHRHLGGRVYSFRHSETGDEVDNGQHLMLGCYHATLNYLRTVGTIDRLALQPSLDIPFRSASRAYRLRAPMLPAPFHVLAALLGLGALGWADRLSILRIVPRLLTERPDTDAELQGMTVDAWLARAGQGDAVRRRLWDILSIGTLNEMPGTASAAMFVKVLQTMFLGTRADSSLALPQAGLSSLFGDGGAAYLASHGGRVVLGARVSGLVVADGLARSAMVAGEKVEPRVVVSAVPQYAASGVIAAASRAALRELEEADRFTPVPIVSIHLWYDTEFMTEEFTALLESPVDWIFRKPRAEHGAPMHLSLVISAARAQSRQAKDEIVAMADGEVRRYFPECAGARLVHALVVKEQRATFSPGTGLAAHRVKHTTAVRNYFIAGDWTDTKLPSTIEGAARSGYACAGLAHEYLVPGAIGAGRS